MSTLRVSPLARPAATAGPRPRQCSAARPGRRVGACASLPAAAAGTAAAAATPARPSQEAPAPPHPPAPLSRRGALQAAAAAAACAVGGSAAGALLAVPPARADDFVTLPSGIKVLTIREGEGAQPQAGDTVAVHWAGFTKGYQGKRLDNTSVRDEPYEFVLGAGQAIPAFERAVEAMRVGGISRVEVPGELPALMYPLDRSQRFTDELLSSDGRIFKYRYGPQPSELGGQRALDFVLDNTTLRDFNRTLLFDIKLLTVRRPRASA